MYAFILVVIYCNYSRKPKDFVCKVLKFENKYYSIKVLLPQKLI